MGEDEGSSNASCQHRLSDGLTLLIENNHRRGKRLPHHTAMRMHKYPETVATPSATKALS